ncbi:hypothetical protein TSTA_008570 [Talaromyces stipitatus ATCC 10500]|uniref:SP-RING-type domain-containing protein n=1 Tax=Talaromyces stipitatus (strain ATCC 10500 / CBS 375.48 / QM 6759 / NRRL 1006) TaxID=441959 RepID=B8MVA5_TALSN|nr:uncharacterized protein TSTA_008570 [Talaromyces stipitatus ATCC 10500]EED11561.1 hypothetical protein TSTA_008570 [Talaromyces stipitatus ATCC 10500]
MSCAADCNAQQTLGTLLQSKSYRLSSSNVDDNDLMIVDRFISINLRDPFTTQIFDIPARGSLCTHMECFDISTFLQTIAAEPLSDSHKIYIRCPICRKDARPGLLLIDEFLGEARNTFQGEQVGDCKGYSHQKRRFLIYCLGYEERHSQRKPEMGPEELWV